VKYRVAGAVVSALTGTAAALIVAVPTAGAAAPRAQLRHSASPDATRTARVGSVASSSKIRFEVDLKLHNQHGAVAFAKAVSTPGSGSYRKYLTAAQWEARFSPSAGDVSRVKSFLTQSGFTVGSATADRMAVSATGTARQIEKAFRTSLSLHRVNGKTLRLADRNLTVPAAIAGVVGGVTGVNQTFATPDNTTGAATPTAAPKDGGPTFPQPPGFRVAPPCGTSYNAQIDNTLPPYGNGYPSNPPWAVCGYTGPQFRSAYGLTSGPNGTGVTVAIVDAYTSPTLFSDAHHFAELNDPSNPLSASQFSELPASHYNNNDLCGASGWFGEETLDVEAVHNTAPGANILFAGAESCLTTALNESLHRIIDGHLASVITNSYGDNGGDLLDSAEDRASTDNLLLMADGTGISVMFSSGDNGDEFTSGGVVSPDYPASSPYSTAIGGTTTQIGADGQMLGQFGWSTARSFLCNSTFESLGGCTDAQLNTWLPIDLALDGGSGGGTSYVYPQPSYQSGVVPSSLSELRGAGPMRVVPDISMEADPATGMLVGETQTFPNGVFYDQYRIGGTSVSSPLFAGVIARADSAAGKSLGFLNPALYSLYGNSGAITDVGPAGKQDQSRSDYANSIGPGDGFLDTTRIIDYEGTEQFCATDNPSTCSQQDVALHAVKGYDNMTGLGAPAAGFVGAIDAAASK
jgi:subtilase family serine protease